MKEKKFFPVHVQDTAHNLVFFRDRSYSYVCFNFHLRKTSYISGLFGKNFHSMESGQSIEKHYLP